ncbi:MAG: alpha/beta hydrolase, partial [Promethearchaeota archaeon]
GLYILGSILIFTTPSGIKISYNLKTQTKDGETISFNVFEPKNGEDKKKVIIIGHGIIVNKEMMKSYAIELANAGFLAITLDFRGHGQSSGFLDTELLANDVRAVKAYIEKRNDIDKNNFGYIGYSMGGDPGQEVVREYKDFKCFIGVGTPLSLVKEDRINRTLNVLMIIAKYDEGTRQHDLKEQFGKLLGIDCDEIRYNRLYGSFKEGNAAKAVIDDNSDHITTAWDADFVREARDWIINTFYDYKIVNEDFYVNIRGIILLLQLIGGFGLFFSLIPIISKLIIKGNKENENFFEIQDDTLNSSQLFSKLLIFSLIFAIPGVLILFPIIFLPLTLPGALLAFIFGQVFSLLIYLKKTFNKKEQRLIDVLKEPFKFEKFLIFRHILIGIIFSAFLYVILWSSIGINYLGITPSVYKIPWSIIYFIIVLFMFHIYGIIQVILQKSLKNRFKTIFISFSLLIIYLSIYSAILIIIIQNFYLIMVLLIAAPILFLAVINSVIFYDSTKNIISGTIVNAFFIVFIIVTLSPFMDIISFIF